MAIETRIPIEEINVKNLSIDGPETESSGLPFDVEKEISPQIWNKLEEEVKVGMKWQPMHAVGLSAALKIIKPKQYDSKVSNDDWDKIIEELKESQIPAPDFPKADISWQEIMDAALSMKIADPDSYKYKHAEQRFLTKEAWVGVMKDLVSFRMVDKADIEVGYYTILAKAVKFLAPERFESIHFGESLEERQVLFEKLKGTLSQARSGKDNFGWFDYGRVAANLKILFPELVNEIELNEDIWKGFRNQLKFLLKENNLHTYGVMVKDLKILSAEKVTLLEDGIQLQMPKFQKQDVSILPEIKKF